MTFIVTVPAWLPGCCGLWLAAALIGLPVVLFLARRAPVIEEYPD